MTSIHPSPEISPRSSAPAGWPKPPAPSKLRDSCHACASSKVKCHKEKPTCSRCAKRGIACEYFATKRAGRKHESRSTSESSKTEKIPRAMPTLSWPTNLSASSEMDYLLSPSLLQPSAQQNAATPNSSDSFSNLFSPVDPFLSSVLTDLSTGFDEFTNSTVAFSLSETSDSDILNQFNFYSGDGSGSSKSRFDSEGNETLLGVLDTSAIFDEPISEHSLLSQPQSPPSSQDSSTDDPHSNGGVQASAESPCFCLIRGLGLMKQLSPIAPTASTSPNGDNNQAATSQLPTIKTVIAENEQVIEAVANMLQCQSWVGTPQQHEENELRRTTAKVQRSPLGHQILAI
ncbi:transcription factor [Hyphodiscus hymeniophilus]|uniref:Transcription factor n=1 Tax=Hyphodiscus hymeniophilus TaxID=353542 RepID=A0A9P7AYN4_9HELO|nr:transcription factor [Hyphodiscus hymeniophilus]